MEHMTDNGIDICFLQETFFTTNDSVKIKEVSDYGFKMLSKPRPRCGGGLGIIYKNNIPLQINNRLPKYKSFEVMEATLQTPKELLRFINIHRTPYSKKHRYTVNAFLNEFEGYLDSLDGKTGTPMLVGDFNIHLEKPSNLDTIYYNELLQGALLSQHVRDPTHEAGGILDHVISADSLNERIDDVHVTKSHTLSDHDFVTFNITGAELPKAVSNKKILQYRNFRAIDIDAFKEDIVQSELNQPEKFSSLDDTCTLYQETLTELMDKHCPILKKKINPRHHPWFDESLRSLRRKRRQAERKFRKNKSQDARLEYIKLRNEFSKTEYMKKTAFHRKAFKDCSKNSKKIFQKINKLTGTENKHLPATSNAQMLSEDFKDFFTEKVKQIRENVIDMQKESLSGVSDVPENDSCCSGLKSFKVLSEEELHQTIKRMSNKFCELDSIPAWLLKECLPELTPVLLYIVNSSLDTGEFPTTLKHAIIRPVIKKNNVDPDILKNYRPISNLSFVSKLTEKVVLDQLNTYLEENALFSSVQSGYRPHHSCETLLIRMNEDIINTIDERKTIALLLLDLSAAFDTIDHNILIKRLQNHYGIKDIALNWFKSYLNKRTFSINVNDVSSSIGFLLFGVPQGSILGPVLFVLYTKDLQKIAEKHGLIIKLYADDSQLYVGFSILNPDEVNDVLKCIENCLMEIKQWMIKNFMMLNEQKTEFILLGTKNDLKKAGTMMLNVDGISINSIKCCGDAGKSLGVMIDDTMSMRRQISDVQKKCAWKLHSLYQIRRYLTTDIKIMLVKTLILSKLDYCNALYAGLPKTLIKKLQGILRNCIRFIYNLDLKRGEDLDAYFLQAHILPVDKRIEFKVCLFVHKSIHSKVPGYIESIIKVYQPAVSSLRTAKDKYMLAYPALPKSKRKLCERQFSYHAPTMWNALPYHIRSCSSTTEFKTKLKTYFFRQVFQC